MQKSRFSDEQLVNILSSVTGGATVREICQSSGVRENTFCAWKHKTSGTESDDIRKIKDLPSENQALMQFVAEQARLIEATEKLYQKTAYGPRPKVGGPLPDFCLAFRNAMHVRSSVLPGVALICH